MATMSPLTFVAACGYRPPALTLAEARAALGRKGDVEIASSLAPGLCDGQIVQQELEFIDRRRRDAAKAEGLAEWPPHLPESGRAGRVEEILSLLPAVPKEYDTARLLGVAASHLPQALIGQALQCSAGIDQEFVRWLLCRFSWRNSVGSRKAFGSSMGSSTLA